MSAVPKLPIELIERMHAELRTPTALIVARSVCKEWLHIDSEPQWRQLFCSRCPTPSAWAQFAHVAGGSWRVAYTRLHMALRTLQTTWTVPFKESHFQGKYSKWVRVLESAYFVPWLVMAVRLLGLTTSAAYFELDGAPARAYNPAHSFGGGGGGHLEHFPENFDDFQLFQVSKHAFLALVMLEQAPALSAPLPQSCQHESDVADHLSTWWGGEARKQLLHAAFDAERFVGILEFVLDGLHMEHSRLNALFWDVHVCSSSSVWTLPTSLGCPHVLII